MAEDHKQNTDTLGIPENACVLLWKHTAITTDGRMRPCCRFKDRDYDFPNINDGLQAGFADGKTYADIRAAMMDNQRLDNCRKCWMTEHSRKEKSSMRTDYNKYYAELIEEGKLTPQQVLEPRLDYLEIAFNDTCNLACRMCGPGLSSKWKSINKHYNLDYDADETYTLDVDKFDMDLSNLETIKIVGGEPLLTKEHDIFIEKLLETHNDLSNLEIIYHTNGTVLPSKKVSDFWKRLRETHVILSLDAYGDLNNYLRPGQISWDKIEQNVRYYVDLAKSNKNIHVGTHTVVSRFNIMKLHELEEFLFSLGMPLDNEAEHSLDPLVHPIEMSLDSASNNAKQRATKYLREMLDQDRLVFDDHTIQGVLGILGRTTDPGDTIDERKLAKSMEMLDEYFDLHFDDQEDVL